MRMIENTPSFLAYKAEKKLAEKINKIHTFSSLRFAN